MAKETVRRALMPPVTEGPAVRGRGSGTYVREFRPIRRRPTALRRGRAGGTGPEPVRSVEEPRTRRPSQEEAERLRLAEGTPVVEVCRTALTEDGRAVEPSRMLLDAGASGEPASSGLPSSSSVPLSCPGWSAPLGDESL